MSYQISIFSHAKRGNTPDENQDAYWPILAPLKDYNAERSYEHRGSHLTIAVADGATEGILGEIWSRMIVRSAGRLFPRLDLKSILNNSYRAWQRYLQWKSRDGRSVTSLPKWLEEPAIEQGTFSTLIAFNISENQNWTAIAVGDSCLFQIREERMILSWPIQNSDEFSKRPYLLSTAESWNQEISNNSRQAHGYWQSDDKFFLMSDALACWFLRKCEQDEKPWITLLNLGTEEVDGTFDLEVERWRDLDQMRNDDVTLIRLEIL
jgi:serine/threonine protein phosphatase PrpC